MVCLIVFVLFWRVFFFFFFFFGGGGVNLQWKIVFRCANQQLIWGVPVRYAKSMKTQHLYFPYLSNMYLSIKFLFSSDNCTLNTCTLSSLYWLIVNMHCLKTLIQKQVIWLPVKYRMNDLYFCIVLCNNALWKNYALWIFPTSKCRYICVLHIKIFED